MDWLTAEMNIRYTQGRLSALLARLKLKPKTGRRVYVRKNEVGQQALKKHQLKAEFEENICFID